MNLTIDASVFVSAARPSEELYSMSYRFLQEVKGMGIFCPTLVLSECGAAIARPTGDSLLSRRLVSLIRHFPGVTQVPLDYSLALRAAEIAIENRLRGADAVYVAVAEEFDAALISWDAEMLQRSPEFVQTMSPEQWLESPAGASEPE
ncbi:MULTISPECIES: type II toxin-antitoxin system VapC family toxin [Methanothrix]|jgi:predicted nucleic acid-binding protein|uniref:type II toxin-antitoxin system VapC family toxin n=1 Tax=Methanothrix TaxID=2222 RepID=UPI0009CD8DFA|nr:PIN domain-containing protein [Methanosaeta sp. UBA458]OPX82138.1 MAG: tRNA(fMet)-specific endonuclease VapC [Methanosaeta sp. PtaB.Bin005]HOE45176.1 PIN domain-containing protein [Methanothrix soehngenii]HOS21781.1 PIN domain-containing protein [Methanothrix soehngenii]HPL20197.1 PIN domain-containing protein [Methanothrix soehngenii]